ncbi:MAG: ATP-binding cassette domain-containing protein [Spirochaetota bacterium]
MQDNVIELRDVTFGFGTHIIFNGLSLSFTRGTFTVIVGGSGEGLSTLLKLAYGIYNPRSGSVTIEGIDTVRSPKADIMKMKSRNGFVFQDDALFSSRTAYQNLAMHRKYNTNMSDAEIEKEIIEHVARFGLTKDRIITARPNVLSGRERRFVNYLRSIIHSPEILFLDSVFDGIDQQADALIRNEICRYVTSGIPITVLAVCNKVSEFAFLAARVIAFKDHVPCFDGSYEEFKKRAEADEYLAEFK